MRLQLQAMCVVAFCCLVVATRASANEQITLGTVTAPSLTYAPHYLAQKKFFPEAGLDVKIIAFDGSGTLLPQLNAKRVQIGWLAPEILAATRQPGRDPMHLTFFYNGSRIEPWEFVALQSGPITSLKDLRGKKIGVLSLTTGNIPITKAILRSVGLEDGKDYQLIAVGPGNGAFYALKTGAVDVLNLYDALHAMLEVSGTPIRRLPIPTEFSDLPAHGFVTHNDFIKDNPDLLIKFGQAFAKATVACDANPDACIQNFWSLFPNQKPVEGNEEQKLAQARIVLKAAMHKYLVFPSNQPVDWGRFDEDGLKHLITALYQGGQFSSPDIDVHSFYTNALIPQINSFSKSQVAEDAKAVK